MAIHDDGAAAAAPSNSDDRGVTHQGRANSAVEDGPPAVRTPDLDDAGWQVDEGELGSLPGLLDAYSGGTLCLTEAIDRAGLLGYSAPDVGRTLAWSGMPSARFEQSVEVAHVDRTGATAGFRKAGEPPRYLPWHTVPQVGRFTQVPISGDLREMSVETWRILERLNAGDSPFLYRFGNRLAWVTDDDGVPRVEILRDDALRHLLCRLIDFTKRNQRGEEVSTHPPSSVIRDLLVDPSPPVPVLRAVSSVPVVTPRGSLHQRRGYDADGRTLYLPPDGFVLPPVMTDPPLGDISRARELLIEDLLGDFPFVGDGDRAHALAAILLPFLRPFVDGPTPLHLIHKPAPGTGATLLTQVMGVVAVGQAFNVMTEARDEDEWRKRITASLLRGPQAILIDNLSKRLDSPALSSALTTRVWEDRILGRSEVVALPVGCLWLATGNNPGLSHEVARRTVPIRLDANAERPWLRDEFRHPDLLTWATRNRDDLVWAALTLIAAWIAKGRPLAATRLGMFEHWAEAIGGVLEVAGVAGFLSNLDDLYEEADIERIEWEAFFTAWYERHGESAVKVKEVFAIADDVLDLSGGTDHARKTSLGKALRDHRGRIIGGMRLRDAGSNQGAIRWRLVPVDLDGGESW